MSAPSDSDPKLEQVGIPADEQQAILELYEKLERIDHYKLLGVSATDDVKTIKRAYFAKAKEHHPDRYFRKDVGALKPKIDAIFAALAKAEAVLGNAKERAIYDAYLSARLKTGLLRRQAAQLEASKNFAAASDVWKRVVEELPTDAYVQHRYAYALLRAGKNLDVALAAATRAIDLDSTRLEYRMTAASLHLAEGRDRTALAQLAIAIELAPDRTDLAGLHAALTERVARAR